MESHAGGADRLVKNLYKLVNVVHVDDLHEPSSVTVAGVGERAVSAGWSLARMQTISFVAGTVRVLSLSE